MFQPSIRQGHDPQWLANIGSLNAKKAQNYVEKLQSDVERLYMITEALWTFIKDKHGYTDKELYDQVMTVDLKDGSLDGRVASTPPRTCMECGRTLHRRHPLCLYCGTPVTKGDVFER